MTALDDIAASVRSQADAYGQTQYTQGKADQALTDAAALASVQQQLDAADLEVTDLTAEVADLKVQLAAAQAGDPTPAKVLPLFGASMQNNGDIAPLEKTAGRHVGVHRTYYNFTQVDAAVAQCKADNAAGRIPWISFKLPVSWADAAAGKMDTEAKDLATKLKAVPGKIWLALHHEPEGDGTMSDFPLMQDHLWPVILAVAPNVVPWVIFTGGDTDTPAKLAALYPKTAKPNLGFDKYNRYGDASHVGKGWSEMKDFYAFVVPEAQKRGVDWGIGETGYTDSAATKDADWLTRAYDDMANAALPGLGLSYFNSSVNSNGTWPLNAVKTPKFAAILNRSR